MNTLRKILDWRRIRALGELQVLTRASYFMLVFVPLLAGLWPGVRLLINRYNQVASDTESALGAASLRLESSIHEVEMLLGDSIPSEQSRQLATDADRIVQQLEARLDT